MGELTINNLEQEKENKIKNINDSCDSLIKNLCEINRAKKEEFKKDIIAEENASLEKLEKEYRKVMEGIYINYEEEKSKLTNNYEKQLNELQTNFSKLAF